MNHQYFGISNIDCLNDPFLTDLNLFPNVCEKVLLNYVNSNAILEIFQEAEISQIVDYDTTPILYQHRENESFKNIWKNVKNGDVITNRASMRSLSLTDKNVICEKKWIDVDEICDDEHPKYFYLIQLKNLNTNIPEKLKLGNAAPAVIFKTSSTKNHSIFRYMKSLHENYTVHYTCEIDGFVKTEINDSVNFEPVEFKCFKNPENRVLEVWDIWDNVRISTAIQCELSGIENVILAFHDNGKHMQLKYYNLNLLKLGIGQNIDGALWKMKKNISNILNRCK